MSSDVSGLEDIDDFFSSVSSITPVTESPTEVVVEAFRQARFSDGIGFKQDCDILCDVVQLVLFYEIPKKMLSGLMSWCTMLWL